LNRNATSRLIARHACRGVASKARRGIYVPDDEASIENYMVKAMTYEMEHYQRRSAEKTVPWFLRNLPPQYFKEIDQNLQKDHLRAMTALSEAGLSSNAEVAKEAQKLCEYCAKGDYESVRSLVFQGANPNLGDYDGRTSYHLAAANGHTEILEYLYDHENGNINLRDNFGTTPLTDAERNGNYETAQWLIENGGTHEGEENLHKPEEGSRTATELMLKSRNRKYVTFFNKDGRADTFRNNVAQLDLSQPLNRVKGFGTFDESMVLQVFEYGKPQLTRGKEVDRVAGKILEHYDNNPQEFDCSREELVEYIKQCPSTYVKFTPKEAFYIHKKMVHEVEGTEKCVAKVVKNTFTNEPHLQDSYWFYLVSTDVFAHSEMSRFVNFLAAHGLNIVRFHMDQLPGNMCILRALISPGVDADGVAKELTEEKTQTLERQMTRLKFLDDAVLQWYERCFPHMKLVQAEIIQTLANMIYGPLNKELPYAFTLERLENTVMMPEHANLIDQISNLFLKKFALTNTLSKEDYEIEEQLIRTSIDKSVQTNVWQRMFHKMLDSVRATYRTNLHLPNRMSLTLRVDPSIMIAATETDREHPYGVFFSHSRRCNGFHVRFREIARGGLRVVPAEGVEGFGLESTRHFDEVYGLASAQQMKNKDIPEGGSKAVLLVNTKDRSPGSRDILMRRCVKYFCDGLLDLITPDEEVHKKTVDYWGKPELLYLGPDENIIPDDILWLTERAKIRGMRYPAAFMSSKPDAGINHKVYGVTSEGVAIFLQVALLENGINPFEEEFTVKITGGPNGDVAGNMIRILDRDYGSNVKIVGMSDHSASVEDETGIDMAELLRLHYDDEPLDCFSPTASKSTTIINLCDTPEGTSMRNSMHNRLKADVFVPGGGRPNTINLLNWKHFLTDDGSPSSKLIVEAANIFITPEARKRLGDAGSMIVKDSSANKAGVCCSSYEIVASMLLNRDEFMEIKEELVEDVLTKLREIARREAILLFREAKLNPDVQMPNVAVLISQAINRATDTFVKVLERDESVLSPEIRKRLIVESLPKKLVTVAEDRLEDLPPAYIRAMLAASLASKMVYAEGVQYIQNLSDEVLGEFACKYITQSDRIRELIIELDELDLERKDEIIEILRHGGTRAALELA